MGDQGILGKKVKFQATFTLDFIMEYVAWYQVLGVIKPFLLF